MQTNMVKKFFKLFVYYFIEEENAVEYIRVIHETRKCKLVANCWVTYYSRIFISFDDDLLSKQSIRKLAK